jgi:hypothetical protein
MDLKGAELADHLPNKNVVTIGFDRPILSFFSSLTWFKCYA